MTFDEAREYYASKPLRYVPDERSVPIEEDNEPYYREYHPEFVSIAQDQWLDYIEWSQNIRLFRGKYEFCIPRTTYKVDGFHPGTNTVYEFYGDYWHGNPRKWQPYQRNNHTGTSFGYLYQRTVRREEKIRSLGYNVITMWEDEWKKKQPVIFTSK